MELNRLLEIANERKFCDFCIDCSDKICVKCDKVKGVKAEELREYHAATFCYWKNRLSHPWGSRGGLKEAIKKAALLQAAESSMRGFEPLIPKGR